MNAIFRSLLIIVGIPTLLASVYFGLIASDVYLSEARFSVRSAKGGDVGGGLAALLGSSGISGGAPETSVVADYVHSHDMLEKVQQKFDFRRHYSDDDVDWLSRLDSDATREELLMHFEETVDLVSDAQSGVITLKARAYDPESAQRLAQLVIDLSESLVNDMSYRIEGDALATAREEVERAALKGRDASATITQFRNSNVSLNPAAESSALLGIVSGIETKLVESRAELGEKRAFMKDNSAEIVSLKNRINALSRQLQLEKGRIVGGGDNAGQEMSGLIESYQPLVLEQELAQQQYASALTSLEVARIEAQRKKQYLVTFIPPSLPDEAVEPRRFHEVLTVMVFSFLLYLIGGLMWSALKDHIGR